MKKLIAVILTLMLICTCSLTVFANGAEYNNALELYQYWEQNDAYPDYVCGVWYADGDMANLVIAVQNTDEGNAGKQEILDLIKGDLGVTFEYREYSFNRLCAVQDELHPYFEKNVGLVSIGIDVTENNVVVGISEESKDVPSTVEMVKEIKNLYGNMIEIEYTGDLSATDAVYIGQEADTGSTGSSTSPIADYVPFIAVGIILLAVASVFIFRKKRAMMLQASTGKTIVSSAPLTVKEVENTIKKSTVDLPTDLDEKIFSAINTINK